MSPQQETSAFFELDDALIQAKALTAALALVFRSAASSQQCAFDSEALHGFAIVSSSLERRLERAMSAFQKICDGRKGG